MPITEEERKRRSRESSKAARAANPEKRRAYAKKYAAENKEKRAEYQKKYAVENRQEMAEYLKQWRAANPDKVGVYRERGKPRKLQRMAERYATDAVHRCRLCEASKAIRIANPEKHRLALRNWYLNNKLAVAAYRREWVKTPAGKASSKNMRERHYDSRRLHSLNYRAMRENAEGRTSNQELHDIFQNQKAICIYCPTKLVRGNWTVEHKIPLSRGGSNWPENIAIACKSCNYSKGARLFPGEWTPRKLQCQAA